MYIPSGTMYIYSEVTYTLMIDMLPQVSHLLPAWCYLR